MSLVYEKKIVDYLHRQFPAHNLVKYCHARCDFKQYGKYLLMNTCDIILENTVLICVISRSMVDVE